MDRTPQTAGPTPSASAPEPPLVRPVTVEPGQQLQATVVRQDGDAVWLGYRGGLLAARTRMPLVPGRSYEFVVTRTEPHVELALARGASAAGRPAPGPPLSGAGLGTLLQHLAALVPEPAGTAPTGITAGVAPMPLAAGAPDAGDPTMPGSLRALLEAWTAGRPTAGALAALDRTLGHEHEARVLRLANGSEPRPSPAALRGAVKAEALRLLDLPASVVEPQRRELAAALVAGLSGVERDNAARREAGAPLWLPLPACPEAGLRDARMFLLAEDGGAGDREAGDDETGDGAARVNVVLLLDLSRLGALRVDVALEGEHLDATFLAERPASATALLQTLDDLGADLERGGVSVGRLRVLTAPKAGLPVADLQLPPRDGSALVDVHA